MTQDALVGCENSRLVGVSIFAAWLPSRHQVPHGQADCRNNRLGCASGMAMQENTSIVSDGDGQTCSPVLMR